MEAVMESANKQMRSNLILTVIKLCGSIGLALFVSKGLLSTAETVAAVAEICLSLLIAALIKKKSALLGWLLGSTALFLINLQFIFLKFAKTFLTFIMLTNVRSMQALSGKMDVYVLWTLIILIISYLPNREDEFSGQFLVVLAIVALAGEGFLFSRIPITTPLSDYIDVAKAIVSNEQLSKAIESGEDTRSLFYRNGIEDGIERPESLTKQPNVVLIFTEGLSQHIVEDKRNIMPNVEKWENETLFFKNYYNHSFATYRGIIGQLYSGYQLNNLDENNLISLQRILRNAGYYTSFINVEPKNRDFSKYLRSMDFHEVIEDTPDVFIGGVNSISDKRAYELLREQIQEKSQQGRPFFTAIYTFGTHVSFDSTHEIFGDGKDLVLNRFYNMDKQFGAFMDFFCESECTDNTLLIFTTDHATYADEDYQRAFPDVNRTYKDVDTIPLFFYYKGMQPKTVDANGRNSLDLVPTVLDYLDVSAPNCFLGSSLFTTPDLNRNWDTTFFYPTQLVSTEQGEIHPLHAEKGETFLEQISKYFCAAKWKDANQDTIDSHALMELDHSDAIETEVSEDCRFLNVKYYPSAEHSNVLFAVWSGVGEIDDLHWYEADWNEKVACWSYQVDLSAHRSFGTFFVHVYTNTDGEKQKLDETSVYIPDAVFPEEYVKTEQIDNSHIRISLITDASHGRIAFPVWSSENGQDDIEWYEAELDENGVWSCVVNVEKHIKKGLLYVHAYDVGGQKNIFLDGIAVYVGLN